MKPTKDRNHSGILLTYNKENILFDCGEGTQRQMKIAGIKPSKINRICISHWHGDHTLGLPGLMSTMGSETTSHKLQIYGPPGTKKYIEYMLKAFYSVGIVEFEVHEVKKGTIYENDNFMLIAEPLKHNISCIGYSFIEKDKFKIKVAKTNKLGIKGPILGELQKGKDIVHEGEKILAKDVTTLVKGKKISYVADTRPCQGIVNLAKNADIVIIECTYHSDEKNKAEEYSHMTAQESAQMTAEAEAKMLILTHPSSRYKTTSSLVEEAQIYHNNVFFAEDFMKFDF